MSAKSLPADPACADGSPPVDQICDHQPDGGVCDPACQTGCACGRCDLAAGDAGVACTPPGGKTLGEVCDPTNDDCVPGFTCFKEACGTNVGRCYQFCSDGAPCPPGGLCDLQLSYSDGTPSPYLACALAPQTCDPFANTGCPGNGVLGCYTTTGSITFCDCPGRGKPPVAIGGRCVFYWDCVPQAMCLGVPNGDGTTQDRCLQICRIGGTDCPAGQLCNPASGLYGYCN